MKMDAKFSKGEKVLCSQGRLIYEATVQATVIEDQKARYLIHYSGWKQGWEEWVSEDCVKKYNDKNISQQKRIQKHNSKDTSSMAKRAKRGKSGLTADTDSRASTSKANNETIPSVKEMRMGTRSSSQTSSLYITKSQSEEEFPKKLEIKLQDELKFKLVDDWDCIVNMQKLANLPAKLTVDQIMENYVAYKKSLPDNSAYKESAAIEISNGIKDYFNVMLETQLLYKFERLQYKAILQQNLDTPMSKTYGAIHLLRLFVKLSEMVAYTPMDERSIQLLQTNIQDFLKYLMENSSTLFSLQDYGDPPAEYFLNYLRCDEILNYHSD